ncbi:MAG: tetratricopeptide repeat protein [Oscillospiraceae bacterium]
MGKYFDDIHAGTDSQLEGKPCKILDTPDISTLRKNATSAETELALSDALSRQMRYREAITVLSHALETVPNDLPCLRSRAGKLLATLQPQAALSDFTHCRRLSGDTLDIGYRRGLCHYYLGDYEQASQSFESIFNLCDDEMGVAAIYWHSLCALRLDRYPSFLSKWQEGMSVGHHTAYDKAVRVLLCNITPKEALSALECETDDMNYAIILYGICVFFQSNGNHGAYAENIKKLLERDGQWPCFAYLAAWNESKPH